MKNLICLNQSLTFLLLLRLGAFAFRSLAPKALGARLLKRLLKNSQKSQTLNLSLISVLIAITPSLNLIFLPC